MNDNNKFDTDKDIIAFVKNLFSTNRIASSLILFFSLNELNGKEEFDPPKVFKYAENNADDMVVKLFDLSITSKIGSVFPSMDWTGGYGAFDLVVVPSMDGQTNITAKLIDFFHLLVTPWGLEKLKEPFNMNNWKMPEITSGYGSSKFIMMPPPNIWELLEGEDG